MAEGFQGIEKSLAKFAEKGTITAEQQKATRDRLSGTTSFADLADCDIMIEAIIENIEEKRKTYAELDRVCKPETIFASNTSSISHHRNDDGDFAGTSETLCRSPLLQSRADHEAG